MNNRMTLEEHNQRKASTYKMMLWFAMVSIFMIFAGFLSAYIVSNNRPDWLKDFSLPNAFLISTLVLILSSLSIQFALKNIKINNHKGTTLFLWLTLLMGIAFICFQFLGFKQVIESGYFFTGAQSNITTSFLYIVVIVHIAHLIGGIISLLIVIYNHYKQKYNSAQTLGIELCATYWHFMDIVWIILFLFFYFFK